MKMLKRVLIIIGVLLVVLLGAAAALPYFFKDQLLAKAKTTINEQVNAEVDFSGVSLSLFRHFPDLSFGLNDLTVTGIDTFAGTPLVRAEQIDLTLDLWSVLRAAEPIRLTGVDLRAPQLHIQVLANGQANYDIARPGSGEPSSDDNEESDLIIQLDQYTIHDGQLRYEDATLDMLLDLQGLDHRGSGNFTLTVYDLDTYTTIQSAVVRYDGVTYLDQARAELDAILQIDQAKQKYTLLDNDLTINALHLLGKGFVQLQQEDLIMDLDLQAPSNEFKELLSLVPGAYLEGYEAVDANGQFSLNARIKGIYRAAQEQYPAFRIDLGVKDARVQYPDLPLGIDHISAQASVNSPSSDLDRMSIDIPQFHLQIGENPLDGRFALKTPLSNPTVDTEIKGLLDLARLSQAFPMTGIEQLGGQITADVRANTSMKQLESRQYDQIDMDGTIEAREVVYASEAYPTVEVAFAKMAFSPRFVALDNLNMRLGESDLQANGRIDNLLAWFSPKMTMTGALTLQSGTFNANEWMPESSPESRESTPAAASPQVPVFDRFDFALNGRIGTLLYEDYVLKNTVARGSISPSRLRIEEASTQIDDSDLRATGQINNLFDYLFAGEALTGTLNITSSRLNLNPFMTPVAEAETSEAAGAAAGESSYGVIRVPKNLNVQINTQVGELQYTNMTLRDLSGALEVAEGAVALRDVIAQAFGGTMRLDGRYDTSESGPPAYSVAYGMEQMQFQSAFASLNTLQTLAPIGRFIEGIFTTRVSLEGTMTENMMPDLSTLDAKGFLETLDGTLKTFPPVQAVANTLNIQELKDNISLNNTRNWFAIKNGQVEVEPFDLNVGDIPLTIAGAHGLNQQMAYDIKAAIPRQKLENNAVGAAAGQAVNQLQAEAQRLGLPFARSETVNVLVELTGTLTDPQVRLKLLGLDGDTSAGKMVQGAIQEQVDAGKEKLATEAKKLADSAKSQAQDKAEAVAEDLKKQAEAQVDSLLKKQAEKILDKSKGQAGVDSLKKALEKFNPFKKKKKTTPPPADTTKKKGSGG